MTIAEGSKLPDATLLHMGDAGAEAVKLSDKLKTIVPNGESLEKAWFIDPEVIARNTAAWTRRWQREVAR